MGEIVSKSVAEALMQGLEEQKRKCTHLREDLWKLHQAINEAEAEFTRQTSFIARVIEGVDMQKFRDAAREDDK